MTNISGDTSAIVRTIAAAWRSGLPDVLAKRNSGQAVAWMGA